MVDDVMPGRLARWLTTVEPDWDAVYAEQLPRVYNFFRYRFGASADVEDLTARTFEKAWRARSGYRRDLAGISTWLLSIARILAVDSAARESRWWRWTRLSRRAGSRLP